MRVDPIPCLRDNYAYVLHRAPDDAAAASPSEAWVVDPSEATPVRAALEAAGLRLAGILLTHHHPDHVGGIESLVDGADNPALIVAGHARDRGRIPRMNVELEAPSHAWVRAPFDLLGLPVEARHIPGHTLAAIAWKIGDEVFTGDTLFAGGCGRLFEGTPAMMFDSLQSLCALPETTRLWFGHEYTAANLRFAASVEPDNAAVQARAATLPECTTPTTVAEERATNPFVRAADADELAARRKLKDEWRG